MGTLDSRHERIVLAYEALGDGEFVRRQQAMLSGYNLSQLSWSSLQRLLDRHLDAIVAEVFHGPWPQPRTD